MWTRKVEVGKAYRHFKGFIVRVLAVAKHTETNEMMVVYSCKDGVYYARPLDMFLSKVDREKYPEAKQEYRFELL